MGRHDVPVIVDERADVDAIGGNGLQEKALPCCEGDHCGLDLSRYYDGQGHSDGCPLKCVKDTKPDDAPHFEVFEINIEIARLPGHVHASFERSKQPAADVG
jgi:hypothetical protein